MTALPDIFHEWLADTMAEDGFSLAHGFAIDAAGGMTVYALDLTPPQAYAAMLSAWSSGQYVELIFGLDRYAKPDQGTTLGDLVAGWHFTAAGPKSFIVEYQYSPRILLPIEWSNAIWTAALWGELSGAVSELSNEALLALLSFLKSLR